MIGVSDAAPRAVNQPELAVDELSQICEGLARQRPENMPALLNALALIAPCSMPFLMWSFLSKIVRRAICWRT